MGYLVGNPERKRLLHYRPQTLNTWRYQIAAVKLSGLDLFLKRLDINYIQRQSAGIIKARYSSPLILYKNAEPSTSIFASTSSDKLLKKAKSKYSLSMVTKILQTCLPKTLDVSNSSNLDNSLGSSSITLRALYSCTKRGGVLNRPRDVTCHMSAYSALAPDIPGCSSTFRRAYSVAHQSFTYIVIYFVVVYIPACIYTLI